MPGQQSFIRNKHLGFHTVQVQAQIQKLESKVLKYCQSVLDILISKSQVLQIVSHTMYCL